MLSRTWSREKIQLESNVTALQLALTSVQTPLEGSFSQSSDPPSSHGGSSDGYVAAIIVLALLTSILGLLLFALVRVAMKAKTQLNVLRFELGQAEKKLEHLGVEHCEEQFHSEIVFDEPPLPQKPERTSWSKLSEQNADLEEQLLKFGVKNQDLSARLDESKNLLRETRLILRQRTLQLEEHKALLAKESVEMDRQQAAHKESLLALQGLNAGLEAKLLQFAQDASEIANLRGQLIEQQVHLEQLTKERDSALANLERCNREEKTDTMAAAVETVSPSVDADLSERTAMLEAKFASVQMAARACLARRKASRLTLLCSDPVESSLLDLRSWKSPSAASLGEPADRRRLFQNLVHLNVSPANRDLSIISEVSSKQSASTRASSLPPGHELRKVAAVSFPRRSSPLHSLLQTQQTSDAVANMLEEESPFLAGASSATPEPTTLTEVYGFT